MKKMSIKNIFPILTAFIAIVFLYQGVIKFGFWDESKGPLGGFFPAIIGSVLLIMSIIAFLSSFKENPPSFVKDDFYVGLGALSVIISTFVIGFFPSIFLYLFLWMKFIEKTSSKTALLTSIGVGGVAFLVFSVWLKVSFPLGFFELLLR